MPNKSVMAAAAAKVDQMRRDLRFAAIDLDVSDEQLLEMRTRVRVAEEELRELSKPRGLLGFLGL